MSGKLVPFGRYRGLRLVVSDAAEIRVRAALEAYDKAAMSGDVKERIEALTELAKARVKSVKRKRSDARN